MAGKKRSLNGQVKPQTHSAPPAQDTAMADATPPCAQPQPPSSKTDSTPSTIPDNQDKSKKPQPASKPAARPPKPHNTTRQKRQKHQKLAKLPPNTSLSKRPLLHAALPTPFANSSSPKILYITASSPYIPALKRVRKLLAQITRRHKQSVAAGRKQATRSGAAYAEANGKLEAGTVEREIAGEARDGGAAVGEQVFVKATGRAIPRALEIGLFFQDEGEFRVAIDMGSVTAIDDVEVKTQPGSQEVDDDADIPEMRLRKLSSVTVSIGLK